MFSFSNLKKYTFVMGGIALAMIPVSAKAGFDWTPPPQMKEPAPVAPQEPMPVAGPLTPEPDSIAPQQAAAPIENVDVSPVPSFLPVPAPKTVSQPAPVATEAPVILSEKPAEAKIEPKVETKAEFKPEPSPPAKIVPEAVAAAPVTAPVSKPRSAVIPVITPAVDIVEGFGKDIPLALALRDIVPSSYAYAFGSGEFAGRKISWRGGKPWKDVLDTALKPLDLVADIQGHVVMISSSHQASVSPIAPVVNPISAAPVTMTARMPEPTSAPLSLSSTIDATPVPVTPSVTLPVPAQQSSPTPSVVDLKVTRKWNANPGMTLRDVLTQWSKESGVDLNWSTAYDYPVNNAFYFEGTYAEAVGSLLSSYGGENPAPKGRLYPNLPNGPSVLMIN